MPAEPTAEELERTAAPARLRRAPRYRGFALAGALVGLVAAIVAVAVSGPAEPGAPLGTGSVLALLAIVLGGFGALLGTGVAVLADRRSVRRSRRAAEDDGASSSAG
ncbi:MAG: hypothetical protein H5T83_12740 [Actinotalea sp.]|nr:hypothetical protein [Actinotalea sp.]